MATRTISGRLSPASLLLFAAWIALLSGSSMAAASEVPSLDLAAWNRAYITRRTNMTEDQKDRYVGSYCEEENSTTPQPSAAELQSCYWKKHSDGTYSAWEKQPGDNRENTNCYCYALNAFKNGFCVPTKIYETSNVTTCALVKEAMIADGAKPIGRDEAMTGQPSSGHYIGMMVRYGGCTPYRCWENDFHAIRKDNNGLWSWKDPSGPANNVDLFGNIITDPEAQIIPGHYDRWCGYFQVWPEKMIIGGSFSDYTRQDNIESERKSGEGFAVWMEASDPYNASVDAAYTDSRTRLYEEDREWESKRGSEEWNAFYKGNAAYSNSYLAGGDGETDILNKQPASKDSGAVAVSVDIGSTGQAAAAAGGRKMLRLKGA